MSDIGALASTIFRRSSGRKRILVALAGPPGSGKSTLSAALVSLFEPGSASVVPMDGFHYDDAILEARGLRARKGAPETFDFGGLRALLQRLKGSEEDIAVPVFDRSMELSRAGAEIITRATRIVIVEGNYLLLDEDPWRDLGPLFDLTIALRVDKNELRSRLVERWRMHGKTDAEGAAWIDSNDMPNIERVEARQRMPDIVFPG